MIPSDFWLRQFRKIPTHNCKVAAGSFRTLMWQGSWQKHCLFLVFRSILQRSWYHEADKMEKSPCVFHLRSVFLSMIWGFHERGSARTPNCISFRASLDTTKQFLNSQWSCSAWTSVQARLTAWKITYNYRDVLLTVLWVDLMFILPRYKTCHFCFMCWHLIS